jgi:hypothetical protein
MFAGTVERRGCGNSGVEGCVGLWQSYGLYKGYIFGVVGLEIVGERGGCRTVIGRY